MTATTIGTVEILVNVDAHGAVRDFNFNLDSDPEGWDGQGGQAARFAVDAMHDAMYAAIQAQQGEGIRAYTVDDVRTLAQVVMRRHALDITVAVA